MNNKLQFRRAILLMFCLGVMFAGLAYRLVDLQVLRHDELSRMAEKNTDKTFWQEARRGDILDVNGNPLATSVPVKTVWANPSMLVSQHLLANPQVTLAHVLAPLLQMDETKLSQKLSPVIYKNKNGDLSTNQYVVLKRQVSDDIWQQIQAALKTVPALVNQTGWHRSDCLALTNLCKTVVGADATQMRTYPNGSLAAQVIGFTQSLDSTNHAPDLIGCDGVERSFNSKLSGVDGWRVTEADHSQRELVARRDEDVGARDGLNVVLTIDSAIQHIVETALVDAAQKHTPKSITGIVIRPKTGEILAMASLPDYDPNNLNTVTTNTRNRMITDIVEPGSTFKIVVLSGALNNGIVKLTDQFYCEQGHFAFAGRVLHDHEAFGNLTAEGIITHSSNIGAAKIGIKLGEQNLYDYACDYGFGQATGIPLPGEMRGILYPVNKWSKVSIAQIPMGHGVAVTRLQIAMAMAAIANNGLLMRPMIVSRLQDRDGRVVEQYEPQAVRQVIRPDTARQMVTALKTVVTKEGTSPEAAMKNYVVAGKTGTAQKVEGGTYVSGKYISSFIGFFPADNPEICIAVVMDEPKEGYYGGKVCGPVFRQIAEGCASYLNIPPDPNLMATNQTAQVAQAATQKF